MTDLAAPRSAKDDFFRNDPGSPLTTQQKRAFRGLRYFPEDPALRLEISARRFPVGDRISMQTSTGELQPYNRHGRFSFEVDGGQAELTIYQGPQGFFMPFVDSLAGTETYPAGRYLEPEPLEGDRFLVDFNLAYNPYCAYNANWSCPLTPFENRLKVPIRAGEQLFDGEH